MAAPAEGAKGGGGPERLRPLHGGRHSLPPDLVAHNQRERLLAALAATVAERGYNSSTVAQITDAAKVSRRTFYEHFSGKEQCFLAAYDVLDEHLVSLTQEALAEQEGWPEQVAAALAAIIAYFASRPAFARLYLVEAVAVGEPMLSRREQTAERFIALLEPGRKHAGRPELSEGMEEALVGGIFTLLARRILSGEGAELERFTPAVIEFGLSPYLGGEAARGVAGGF